MVHRELHSDDVSHDADSGVAGSVTGTAFDIAISVRDVGNLSDCGMGTYFFVPLPTGFGDVQSLKRDERLNGLV